MKIRSGFVSNSSSSSYIIRGIKVDADKASEIVGEEAIQKDSYPDDYDNKEECRLSAIENALWHRFRDGDLATHRMNYFYYDQIDNDPDKDKFVIGKEVASLNDGEWGELPESTPETDKEIRDALAELGITGELKTYAYYLSNDNY